MFFYMADEISAIIKAVEKLDEIYKVGHEIAQLIPNEDRKGEIYAVAGGSKNDVALQQSLFMAQYQLLNNTFGIEPTNFKEWADNFEKCFPNIIKNNPNIDGNQVKPWMTTIDNRPRIRVVNVPAQQREIPTTIYVEFEPERNSPEEVYFLAGTITQVVQMIWAIWNQRQVLKHQNLTQVLGQPVDEIMIRKPLQGLWLICVLSNYKTPPFYKSTTRPDFKEVQIAIPFVNRTRLAYSTIREAFGGNSGLDWGAYRAVAHVADNPDFYTGGRGLPQVWCRGSSYELANKNVKQVLTLSDAKITRINEGKLNNSDNLNANYNDNPPAKVYPNHFFLINYELVNQAVSPARQRKLGKYATKKNKFLLWPPTAPPDFTDKINELLATSGGNAPQ